MLLLRVVEKYAEIFNPLDCILDSHLVMSGELIAIVKYHIARTRKRRKKASRFLTFNGWDV